MSEGHDQGRTLDRRPGERVRPRGAAGSPTCAIVDVDGTLVDSVWHHTVAWLRAFQDHGHRIPASVVHPLVGMTAAAVVEQLVGSARPQIIESQGRHFAALRHLVRPTPGARELLERLHRGGVTVVIASSATPDDLSAQLESMDVGPFVDHRLDREDVRASKPDPEVVIRALERAGTTPARALVIGDTIWDVRAAARAGVASVGLLSGGARRAELLEAGATAVHQHPADLLDHPYSGPLSDLLRTASGRDPGDGGSPAPATRSDPCGSAAGRD